MRKKFRFFVITLFYVFPLFLAATPAVSTAQVVINEFMSDPARDWDGDGVYSFRDDEWIEIANLGNSPVDLAGYRLSDGDGDPVWRYGFSGVLQPGAVKVVYGSDSRAWEESAGEGVYGLSLNNSGDRISLFLLTASDTLLVDSRDYSGGLYEDDRSCGRSPDDPGSWEIFDAYNPCPAGSDPTGNGCIPTPGFPNTCTTSSESASWGSIKSAGTR